MIALCALIFASVCIPQKYANLVDIGALFTSEEMQRQNVRAEIEQRKSGITIRIFWSDSIQIVNPSNLDRHCDDKLCVFYRRHCSSGTNCTYAFSALPRNDAYRAKTIHFHKTLTVEAPSSGSFADIESRFGMTAAPDTFRTHRASIIKLSRLAKESPDVLVPSVPRLTRP